MSPMRNSVGAYCHCSIESRCDQYKGRDIGLLREECRVQPLVECLPTRLLLGC